MTGGPKRHKPLCLTFQQNSLWNSKISIKTCWFSFKCHILSGVIFTFVYKLHFSLAVGNSLEIGKFFDNHLQNSSNWTYLKVNSAKLSWFDDLFSILFTLYQKSEEFAWTWHFGKIGSWFDHVIEVSVALKVASKVAQPLSASNTCYFSNKRVVAIYKSLSWHQFICTTQ